MRKFRNFKISGVIFIYSILIFTTSFSNIFSKTGQDTIVNLTIGEPDSLDPHFDYETAGAEVILNMYDMLLEYKGSSVKEFLPRVSLEVPTIKNGGIKDGGKTYIFKIRKGIKFWSGDDLTAEDVAYSFRRALVFSPLGGPTWIFFDPLLNSNGLEPMVEKYLGKPWNEIFDDKGNVKPQYTDKLESFYRDIIEPVVEVKGDLVIFHLKKVFPPFLNIMAQYASFSAILDKNCCIKQKGMWDGTSKEWWKTHNMKKEDSSLYAAAMGSGPYKLISWDRAQKKLTLERNENYWKGPASVKRIIIQGVDEWSTRLAMLEKGEADIIYVDPQYIDQVKGKKGTVLNENLTTMSLTAVQTTWNVNPDSKYIGSGKLDGDGIPPDFFSDKNVRLGFIYSYDADTFIRDVLHGLGKRIGTCLPDTFIGYSEKIPKYVFDLNKASDYFKKAFKGKLWSAGFKMILLYNNGNDTRQKLAEMMRNNLAKINPKFQVDVRGVDWPTYLDAQKNRTMPFYVIGWQADYPDPNNFIYTYYSSYGDYGRFYGDDYKKYASSKIPPLGGKSLDEAINEASTTLDEAKRADLYIKIQQIVNADGVNLPLYLNIGMNLMNDRIKGFISNPMRGSDFFEYIQLSKSI